MEGTNVFMNNILTELIDLDSYKLVQFFVVTISQSKRQLAVLVHTG